VEQVINAHGNGEGYVILLTNDSAYWKNPRNRSTIDAEFRLHNGRVLNGALRWRKAGAGTMKGRETELVLQGRYWLQWQDYADLSVSGYSRFRYLMLSIKPGNKNAT